MHRPPRWKVRLCFSVIACTLTGIEALEAGDMRPAEQPVASAAAPAPLDGLSFEGEFGLVGKGARGTDTWVFQNGSFISKSCVECGYPQSVYSARMDSGGISFKTKTDCPVSDAQIVWEGTVEDGVIQGVFTWTKKRWYRTIEKRFWFRGAADQTLADSDGSAR